MQCMLFGGLLLAIFQVISASQILLPIRETGKDVAYIIIAGSGLTYDQYEAIGVQIQIASEQRVWIQLSNNTEIGGLILQAAKDQLYAQGFPADGFLFGGGHSYGAGVAVTEIEAVPDIVDAAILFGTAGSHDRDTFPLPLFLVNSDLDGQVRITITADSFNYVKQNFESTQDESIKLYYPHALVYGVNHAQYCTGDLPERVMEFWIEPEVSDDVSRQLIAESIAPFITYSSSDNATLREEARQKLLAYYDEYDVELEPIFSAFTAEQDEDTSPWCVQAQYIISDVTDDLAQRMEVNNTIVPRDDLGTSRAKIYELEDGDILVTTASSIDRPQTLDNLYESAAMIEVKFKSSEAIKEALTGEDIAFDNITAQCRDANQEAWRWVLSELVPEKQRSRYEARNITVEFLQDVYAVTGPGWLGADLVFDFNGTALDIQSTNLITSADLITETYAGVHYCKLLSPAKALEFIYVDALYETYYFHN